MLHTANPAQLDAWDGTEGRVWTDHAAVLETSVAGYDAPFLAAARLRPGLHVLDVGCGTGATTRAVAARGATAVGVDLSAAMLDLARAQAPPGTSFLQADAQVHPFPPTSFDVVLSRTGAMFFADPAAAFANLARALRPGGRLVLLTWRAFADNAWLREMLTALTGSEPPAPPPGPGPFGLSDPAVVREVLADFCDVEITGLRAPMRLGRDADEAEAVLTDLLAWLPATDRGRADLRALLRARSGPAGVCLDSAAWLVTADR